MFRYHDSLARICTKYRALLTVLGSGLGISLLFLSCGHDAAEMSESGSENLGFSRSELRSSQAARLGALKAVELLEDAGWCEIPSKALPQGMSHSDLVRQMACIANKESTFGRDTFGPVVTEAGRPFGFWQIVTGHMGQRVTVNGKTYSCSAKGSSQLQHDPKISAKCALYVYMESVSRGVSGLRPWEAVCSASERNMLANDGTPVFRPACKKETCPEPRSAAGSNETANAAVRGGSQCQAAPAATAAPKGTPSPKEKPATTAKATP
jgi:hypothetical protein